MTTEGPQAPPRRGGSVLVELIRLVVVVICTGLGYQISRAIVDDVESTRILVGTLLGSSVGYVLGGMLGALILFLVLVLPGIAADVAGVLQEWCAVLSHHEGLADASHTEPDRALPTPPRRGQRES